MVSSYSLLLGLAIRLGLFWYVFLSVLISAILFYVLCFCCVRFSFSVLSLISCEERLRNDLFCVESLEWDVKP